MNSDLTADIFRRWGYLRADIDPLGRLATIPHRILDEACGNHTEKWRSIYCSKIGMEFMHMPYPERCDWIAERLETSCPIVNQNFVLKRLLSAETFEQFLHTRYVGTKRFSLEGIASLIPLLDAVLDQAAEHGFEIVMIGMSHRGRLNVMHHIAGTLAEYIIASFEDVDPRSALGSDDVKYHKGATGNYTTESGKELEIHLASNPSHLEAINPVIMGRVRACQERLRDADNSKVLAVILHGDAAFAGQGITAEALNFAEIPGFRIGGTIHIIVNNMVGFTATPEALYSGFFASDVAKRLPIPIFHVNAESPEHVAQVGRLATDYRHVFLNDVVVDLVGYRRYGHSEIDDPTTTDPIIYDKIKERPLFFQTYAKHIGFDQQEIKQMEQQAFAVLEESLKKGRLMTKKPSLARSPNYWAPFTGGLYDSSFEVPTSLPLEQLQLLSDAVTAVPKDFVLHPKIKKLFEQRRAMAQGEKPVDWGLAEALAFASLLQEGTPVRLTGQDCRRGTFNHRHAVVYDVKTGQEWIPLTQITKGQSRFDVYNSMLSEAAVLGFEYGFTRDYPECLVCWEAQFGDFANGAQIIIDQFITAAEDKWQLPSGLVMLLPHGYEGQGPEHSSARLERYLHLTAKDNIQVCQPSTAGQFFHLLRRQALRKWRKPLIVMTPKSMLRAPVACSPISELSKGYFQTVLDDRQGPASAGRLLLCSGKILHELRKERNRLKEENTAIVSVEQLYPLPEEELVQIFDRYAAAKTITWVQEEPSNHGARFYILPHLERLTNGRRVTTVRRSDSASPATGSYKAHRMEQEAIIKLAFVSYD